MELVEVHNEVIVYFDMHEILGLNIMQAVLFIKEITYLVVFEKIDEMNLEVDFILQEMILDLDLD